MTESKDNDRHPLPDTVVYALRGHGSIVYGNGEQRKDLAPGDFAIIPAYVLYYVFMHCEVLRFLQLRGASGSQPRR